jgi:hypothetical protein
MQYILTVDEYNGLLKRKKILEDENTQKLQNLCSKIACEMPIKFWNNTEATPWGCILVPESRIEYCDECPVQEICPKQYKSWSQ